MQRLTSNRGQIELFETLENLKMVRGKYMEAFEKLKAQETIVFVDGDRSANLIATDIWNVINVSSGTLP
jgi:dTMP kinase